MLNTSGTGAPVGPHPEGPLAAALKPVYTPVNADAPQTALLELADTELGRKHKATPRGLGKAISNAPSAFHRPTSRQGPVVVPLRSDT